MNGWSIQFGAQSDVKMVRSATVLILFGMRVEPELLAGKRIPLVQQFGVGADTIDLVPARGLGTPITNALSEVSGMVGTVMEGAILLVLTCARLPSVRQDNLAASCWARRCPSTLDLRVRRLGSWGWVRLARPSYGA